MKLAILKKLVNPYIKAPIWKQANSPMPKEYLEIKRYFRRFKGQSQEHELSARDLFELFKLISDPSEIQLIKAIQTSFASSVLFKIFNILKKHNFFNSLKGRVISSLLDSYNENQLNIFLQLLCALDEASLLKEDKLDELMCQHDLNPIAILFLQLKHAGIQISDDLLDLIFSQKNLKQVIKVSAILSDPAIACFNVANITLLLKQDYLDFIDLIPILKTLQQADLLTNYRFKMSCISQDKKYINKILQLLSSRHLLDANKKIVDQLLHDVLPVCNFCFLIAYLDQSGILNQNIITTCLHHPLSDKQAIFSLIRRLSKIDFAINEKQLSDLLLLSERNIERLEVLIMRLASIDQLSPDTFEAAFNRIKISLPFIPADAVEKRSRKETGLARSEMIVHSTIPPLRFFMQHRPSKKYDRGGFSTVKECYSSLDSQLPIYGIKRLRETELPAEPQRELKYNFLLGRKALFFSRNDKTMLVMEWQSGRALAKISKTTLQNATYETRLQCLLSGLEELNTLHVNFSVHGDIKAENYIVDLQQAKMALIDFGGSRKWGAVRMGGDNLTYPFTCTPLYCDPQLSQSKTYSYNFCDDIYSMGIVIAKLFPELFFVLEKNVKTARVYKFEISKPTILEQALISLVDSMMSDDRDQRCTSKDALDFCRALLSNLNRLDEPLLSKIKDRTINRSDATLEDVFRGAMRATR